MDVPSQGCAENRKKMSGFSAQWLMFVAFGLVIMLVFIFMIIRTRNKKV